MSDLDVRVGDAERGAAVERLAVHFREGRIDEEELEERTAAANAARARHRRERIVSAVSLAAFLWIIWLATGAEGFAWPAIPSAVIGLGLVQDLWGGGRRHHHGRGRHAQRELRSRRRDLRR